MRLYHPTDIAIEPIDDRDALEKAVNISDEFYIPSCAKGVVKMVHAGLPVENFLEVGETVYFDPKMLIEIKELNLVIVDVKSVLLRVG